MSPFLVRLLCPVVFALAAVPSNAAAPIPVIPSATAQEIDGKIYDLVVVGGTPGGIACAVRAAREGCTVLLVNHTGHLGGFITSGGGGWEAPYDGLRSPLYAEMRLNGAAYYRETYGENSPQHRASMPDPKSNSHFDRPKIEPRIAELLFDRMVAAEKRITVLKNHVVHSVERDGALITAVTFKPMHGDGTCRVTAKIFADGMYEGDLMAAAKVPYQVGRESRSTYGEPHAGVIYAMEREKPPGQPGFPRDAVEGRLKIRYNSHATAELLPGSTGEGDAPVMAYNYRLILTKDPANRVMVAKPKEYVEDVIARTAGGGFVPNLPNNKVAWNAGRLIGPQNGYPDGDWPTREKISHLYLNTMLSLLWYYQNDPRATPKEREFWKDYGLAADEFADNGNVPYEIYVREARRLVGRHVFTEHDNLVQPGMGRTPIHGDSIAMTDWPVDSVACVDRSVPGSNKDGIFFLGEESRPAQVPYRSLLPRGVDNLLVPVPLSASHVGWGSIRLEPVWMQTGEAAGFAAALALKHGTTPAALDSDLLLRTLVEHRTIISFFNDVHVEDGARWTPAVQFLGTKGFFNSYDARPGDPLRAGTAEVWTRVAGRLAARESYDPNEEARRLPLEDDANQKEVTAQAFAAGLESALRERGLPVASVKTTLSSLSIDADKPLGRGDACRIVHEILRRF